MKKIEGEIKLSSRERVKTALQHKKPDRIPRDFLAEPEVWNGLMKHFKVRSREEVLQKFGVDCRIISYDSFCHPEEKRNKIPAKEDIKVDIWGAHRKRTPFSSGAYDELCYSPLSDAVSIDDLKTYNWPKPEWWDFNSLPQILKKMDNIDEYHIRYRIGSIFETSWSLLGFERFLTDLSLQPQIPCYIMDRILEVHIENLRKVLELCGDRIDMVYSYDDVAAQDGLLISPGMWRKYIKPRQKKLYAIAHAYQKDIMYHCCGAVYPLIKELLEMGVKLLNPIQPLVKGMDPIKLKEEFGDRLSFHGAIDIQELLPRGTPEKVSAEVNRICKIVGRNGGYILAGSHHFQTDIPISNILVIYH